MKLGLLLPAQMAPEDVATAESLRVSEVGLAAVFGLTHIRPASRAASVGQILRRSAVVAIRRLSGIDPGRAAVSARKYARSHGIECWDVPTANHLATAEALRRSGVDHVVARGAGILRAILLQIPGVTFLNAHAGRLPKYGGMNVVEWSVFNSEPVYGTIHRIDAGIDTGDILDEALLRLGRPSTVAALRAAAFAAVWGMLPAAVVALARKEIRFRPQPKDQRAIQWFRMHRELLRHVQSRLDDGGFFEIQERAIQTGLSK